jgi:serine/threonine-protein kinase HipA
VTLRSDLSAARRVRVADVYKSGILAGRLQRADGQVQFHYTADYLGAGRLPVATTLPLTDRPVVTPAGAVPPFFAGLLPEGRRLTGLRRAVKTSADDELSLLLAVGADPVGDVQVVPGGDRPAETEPLISVDRSFEEVTFADLMAEGDIVDPVSLAGLQDKASARMLSMPVHHAGHRYILKIDPPEFPQVVANEAYFIALAARARFPVVDARIVQDATGRPGLLVRRFDRIGDGAGRTRSLAVEDGAQLLGVYPADKYAIPYEDLLRAVARVCPARPLAAREVFRQLCFAWLTGNGDLHAKNVSVVAAPDGEWRVAPAYDLPSTLPYRDHSMALSLGGRAQGLSRKHLLRFAADVGLAGAAAVRVLDETLTATASVIEDWPDGASPFGPQVTRDVVRSLRQRRRSALPIE